MARSTGVRNPPKLLLTKQTFDVFILISVKWNLSSHIFYFIYMQRLAIQFVEMHCTRTHINFLAPLALGHVSYCHHFSSFVRPPTFYILIFSSETTGPIATKLWWNGPGMAPFQNCVRWSRFPTKMATKLNIEKRGDEILIVHCCFSVSQNELKF
jgi:hypothetical protein